MARFRDRRSAERTPGKCCVPREKWFALSSLVHPYQFSSVVYHMGGAGKGQTAAEGSFPGIEVGGCPTPEHRKVLGSWHAATVNKPPLGVLKNARRNYYAAIQYAMGL